MKEQTETTVCFANRAPFLSKLTNTNVSLLLPVVVAFMMAITATDALPDATRRNFPAAFLMHSNSIGTRRPFQDTLVVAHGRDTEDQTRCTTGVPSIPFAQQPQRQQRQKPNVTARYAYLGSVRTNHGDHDFANNAGNLNNNSNNIMKKTTNGGFSSSSTQTMALKRLLDEAELVLARSKAVGATDAFQDDIQELMQDLTSAMNVNSNDKNRETTQQPESDDITTNSRSETTQRTKLQVARLLDDALGAYMKALTTGAPSVDQEKEHMEKLAAEYRELSSSSIGEEESAGAKVATTSGSEEETGGIDNRRRPVPSDSWQSFRNRLDRVKQDLSSVDNNQAPKGVTPRAAVSLGPAAPEITDPVTTKLFAKSIANDLQSQSNTISTRESSSRTAKVYAPEPSRPTKKKAPPTQSVQASTNEPVLSQAAQQRKSDQTMAKVSFVSEPNLKAEAAQQEFFSNYEQVHTGASFKEQSKPKSDQNTAKISSGSEPKLKKEAVQQESHPNKAEASTVTSFQEDSKLKSDQSMAKISDVSQPVFEEDEKAKQEPIQPKVKAAAFASYKDVTTRTRARAPSSKTSPTVALEAQEALPKVVFANNDKPDVSALKNILRQATLWLSNANEKGVEESLREEVSGMIHEMEHFLYCATADDAGTKKSQQLSPDSNLDGDVKERPQKEDFMMVSGASAVSFFQDRLEALQMVNVEEDDSSKPNQSVRTSTTKTTKEELPLEAAPRPMIMTEPISKRAILAPSDFPLRSSLPAQEDMAVVNTPTMLRDRISKNPTSFKVSVNNQQTSASSKAFSEEKSCLPSDTTFISVNDQDAPWYRSNYNWGSASTVCGTIGGIDVDTVRQLRP